MTELSPERYAELSLPQLLSEGKALVEFGKSIFETPISVALDDAPSLMALAFATKQLEHALSVEILALNNCHRDCELIGRASLEGYIFLAWAFVPDAALRITRTGRWLAYEFVEEYRALKRRDELSRLSANQENPVTQDEWDSVRQHLFSRSESLLKSKYRKLPPDRRAIPYEDYWEYKWNNESVENMINEIGDNDARRWYKTASQWIHWSPYPIFTAVNLDGVEPIWFKPTAFDAAARGAATVYYSLGCCLLILDSHLELGYDEIIRSKSPFNLPIFSQ